MRWLARWATVLLLPATFLAVAPPSNAIGPCDPDPPIPETPGQGTTGFFTSPPDVLPPADADPFSDHPTHSIYEVYGYAGSTFHIYKDDCSPSPTDGADALFTSLANLVFEFPKFVTAFTVSILDAAYDPTWLDVFDPVLTDATNALRDGIYERWILLFVSIIAVMIMVKARGGQLAAAATAIGWAVLMMCIATALFTWPVDAGHAADEIIPSTLGEVAQGINGTTDSATTDATSGMLVDTVVFEQWKVGTFGTSDSPVVDEMAPAIFDAQALTWREAAQVAQWQADGNTDAVEDLYDEKADQWNAAADVIEDEDPVAYSNLQGNNGWTRAGQAALAGLIALVACPFLLVSAFMILCGYMVIRLAVILAPAIITVGILSPMSGMVVGAASVCAAAILNNIIFGSGSLVYLLLVRLMFDPAADIAVWQALLLLALFTFAFWALLRAFRRVSVMRSRHHNVLGDAAGGTAVSARKAGRSMWRFAANAGASYVGTKAALGGDDTPGVPGGGDYGGQVRRPSPYRLRRAEGYTRPDTPTPEPLPAAATVPEPAAVGPAHAPAAGLPAAVPVPIPVPVGRRAAGSLPAAHTPNGAEQPGDVSTPPPTPLPPGGTPHPDPAAEPADPRLVVPPRPAHPGDGGHIYEPGTPPVTERPDPPPRPVEPQLIDGAEVYKIYDPDAAKDER